MTQMYYLFDKGRYIYVLLPPYERPALRFASHTTSLFLHPHHLWA